MAKPYKILRDKLPQNARIKAQKKAEKLLSEMPLQELRQARSFTQEQLASLLKVKQASISKIERRTDMYISTLRVFLKAMGGDLEIVARSPDGDVKITKFEDLDEEIPDRANQENYPPSV